MAEIKKEKTVVDKFNDVVAEINSNLGGVINDLKKEVDTYYEHHNNVDISHVKPCGDVERQPHYTPTDEAIANQHIDQVIREISADPVKWGDLMEISPDTFNAGSGKGSESGRVPFPPLVYPDWLDEIKKDVNIFFRRGKSRSYYDIESLTRGLPKKEKVKRQIRKRSLFILLDVSGSMWSGTYKGVPLIELMIRYLPAIAGRYEGELWQVDDGSPQIKIPLKEFRGKNIQAMALAGGGGTNYDRAFIQLNEKKKELDADFLTVVFTDGEVSWNESVMPRNMLIVAPKDMERLLPKDDAQLDRRSVLIQVDPK